jgi:hypothetical protein
MNLSKKYNLFIFLEMTIQKLYLPISSTMTINTMPLRFTDMPNSSGPGTRKTILFNLPDAFLESSGPKYVLVRHCRALYYGSLPGDVKLHSTIVSVAPYDDSFVAFCNETLTKPKKFQCNSSTKTLEFWWRDMFGQEVPIDAFVIELLLEWTNKA